MCLKELLAMMLWPIHDEHRNPTNNKPRLRLRLGRVFSERPSRFLQVIPPDSRLLMIMCPTMLFCRAVPAWRPEAWQWAQPTVYDPRKGLCLLFFRWTAAALSWPIYLGSVNRLASLAFRHLTRSFCPETQLPESLGETKPLNHDKVVNLGGAFKWASPSNQSVQWQIRQEGAAESSAMSPYEGGRKKSSPVQRTIVLCMWMAP